MDPHRLRSEGCGTLATEEEGETKLSTAVKESYFWSQVKAGFVANGVLADRIENSAGTGICDVNACKDGKVVWVELKVFHGNRLHFRTSQRIWIMKRLAAGDTIFILARKDQSNGGASIYLWPGRIAVDTPRKVEKEGKSYSVLMEDLPPPIFGCAKPFKWELLVANLFCPPF